MHPTAARSNRSSLQSSIPPLSAASSILHPPQQHQQQILYGPIANSMVTVQPCGTSVHPSCVYPGAQRNTGLPNPVPFHMQGKPTRWPTKNKVLRGQQQYCQQQQQQHVQQVYNPKPLILFDQTPSNAPPHSPTTSFLVASSTFTHGSFSGDQYNNPGVTLIPQPYFKPPEVQTFCLLQDRQSAQQHQQEQSSHGSYYNISAANACSLQTNSTFQFPNLGPYASVATFANNQIAGPVQTVQSTQVFPNPPVSLLFGNSQREKPSSSLSTFDISTFKCTRSKLPAVGNSQVVPSASESYNEWPREIIGSASNGMFDVKPIIEEASQENPETSPKKIDPSVITKAQDYSDESSASFDFTIEAEKMVSALCNTTSSNDIGKDENRINEDKSAPLFSGAGDTVSNKSTWFADFCVDYGTSASIAIQTDGPTLDGSQYPELIRKAAFWGCTEAEIILSNDSKMDCKYNWLKNLSSATKTAITKSSTCFPIFAGDRIFANDLINSLIRVTNGWLILDNYLNKQHYPSLSEKFDQELVRCFKVWEESTHELLNHVVQTFLKLKENSEVSGSEQKLTESMGTSFPGDVNLYTSNDLFDPPRKQDPNNKKTDQECSFNSTQFTSPQLSSECSRNFRGYDQQRQSSQKETKSRSKWTVTENLTPTTDTAKSGHDMFLGHGEASVQTGSRFRTRTLTPSNKIDTSTQSLNAEFFHLRSKVLEGNYDTGKQWMLKDKKQEVLESKVPTNECIEPIFKLRPTDGTSENPYFQKYLKESFVNSTNPEVYFAPSPEHLTNIDHNYAVCPPYAIGYGNKNFKNLDQSYRTSNVDLFYVGKSSTNQIELAAVPKNKMTLLSQIEPSLPDKSSEEMTANLSAWFASMRNSECNRQIPIASFGETRTPENVEPRLSRQEMSKSTMDLTRQLQLDANRQLQTLQNMQSIQSAPWNVGNLINNRVQVQQIPEEYDSSEDVRVYMKPGSYNVPKKRHQRRSNRRLDNSSLTRNAATGVAGNQRNYVAKDKTFHTPASSTPVPRTTMASVCTSANNSAMKLPFLTTPIVQSHAVFVENSPRILKRSDSSGIPQDETWKAACASAEILLEALNVKEDVDSTSCKEIERNNEENNDDTRKDDKIDSALRLMQNQEKSQESLSKTVKDENDGCGGASSYEASEDDSGSTYRLSPNTSINEVSQSSENKSGFNKMNVKTDSWLIRTLNNASIASKQKRRKNSDQQTSESSNSSMMEDESAVSFVTLTTADNATAVGTTAAIESFQEMHQESTDTPIKTEKTIPEKTGRVVEKATYSETVRRSNPSSTMLSEKNETCRKSKLNVASASSICSTVVPIPGRRCQRKDPERSYHLLHKSRKSSGKRTGKNCEIHDSQIDEGSCIKCRNSKSDAVKDNTFVCPCVNSTIETVRHGKKKDNGSNYADILEGKFTGKSGDRGWSVWYSSKRKQSLSPLALSKLETIHQAVWQMEESQIFKCPTSDHGADNNHCSTNTFEDYCKVIKSPMFLETVEYKLKNRIYHKVEHAIRDFRRIVYNSKLYHKNDQSRVKTIEALSKKLEELFEEHFASWDFGDVSGSPRKNSPLQQRLKSVGQKSMTGRYGKKSPSPSVVAENV